MSETIILVDRNDNQIGTAEKLKAHQDNALHRAFSIYIFNEKGEILLQKRAKGKYHSGGLWSNTCCSHPRVEEKLNEAIHRRLEEEMGFDTALHKSHETIYQCNFDNGISEHEFLHVFMGTYNGDVIMNPEEGEDFKWANPEEIVQDMKTSPQLYSFWFKKCFEKVLKTAQDSQLYD
jgi:isopentenyl-diphosphate delta-isomerase